MSETQGGSLRDRAVPIPTLAIGCDIAAAEAGKIKTRSYASPEWRVSAYPGIDRRDDDNDDDSTHHARSDEFIVDSSQGVPGASGTLVPATLRIPSNRGTQEEEDQETIRLTG